MKKKIGLYGGSFDPPHHGHLHVALTALESGKVDEVWVIPALRNPLRLKGPIIESRHRLEMVKLAFLPCPQIIVCDIELQKGFSYTIDTVRALHQTSNHLFHLLLGSDCLGQLAQWKEYAQLLELAPPYFIGRKEITKNQLGLQLNQLTIPSSLRHTLLDSWIDAPLLDISSTQIRQRLKEGLYCGHLVPQSVLRYIAGLGFYSDCTHVKE